MRKRTKKTHKGIIEEVPGDLKRNRKTGRLAAWRPSNFQTNFVIIPADVLSEVSTH